MDMFREVMLTISFKFLFRPSRSN